MSTITSSGGTIGILYDAGTFSYQIDSGSFINISSWPVTINNTSVSDTLTVNFLSNATFSSTSDYFICGSNNIIFDGGLKTMYIVAGTNYLGLIQNGTSISSGYNDIICENFIINNGGSTLITGGGWLGQSYFGRGATGCEITNCKSNQYCLISSGSGGILGSYSGSNSGSITINKCYSTGNINGGGITGDYTGDNGGNVVITNCYTNGDIPVGGGIIGSNSGTNGYISISNCYTKGVIANGGGIVGANSGIGGTIIVNNCYTLSYINTGCGGIVGASYGNVICTHCYSSGQSAVSNQNGIYAGSSLDNALGSNNYSEANNGITTGWNDVNASTYLLNGPVGYVQGSVWTDPLFLSPTNYWLLSAFNSVMYSPNTVTVYPDTIYISGSPILTGGLNQITTVNNSITYSDISMDFVTGIITFTNKPVGTYSLVTWNYDIESFAPSNYNFSTFVLTVVNRPTINYYSSKNGALTEDSSKLLGSTTTSYKVGEIETGSLGKVTRWNIASNSTGSSLKRYVYSNDAILNHEGSPTYYLYPAKFKRSLRAKRVLNQSFKIVPVWEGYNYYMNKADKLGFSRLYYDYYVKKYNKKH